MKKTGKYLNVVIGQFPITLNIEENLDQILQFVSQSYEDDMVVLPEGALSGYEEDPSFLDQIDIDYLANAITKIREEVSKKRISIVFGSCMIDGDKWFNAGLFINPQGQLFKYDKINLATSERGYFTAGSQLPVFELNNQRTSCKFSIQLCREIRYPEQWKYLAQQQSDFFVFLTNAVGDINQSSIWRSHLISRAAENQRYILCANNSHKEQKCPSMLISPSGEVLWEVLSDVKEMIRHKIHLDEISNWYIDQSREDVVAIRRIHESNLIASGVSPET